MQGYIFQPKQRYTVYANGTDSTTPSDAAHKSSDATPTDSEPNYDADHADANK